MNAIRLCDVINVDHVKDIPVDYYGVMGVPITYMAKHDPEEFEILGMARPTVKGVKKYVRILIRRKIRKETDKKEWTIRRKERPHGRRGNHMTGGKP